MLDFIWNLLNLIVNTAILVWFLLFFLFGGRWQVGNFMSIKINAILRKSKHKYK